MTNILYSILYIRIKHKTINAKIQPIRNTNYPTLNQSRKDMVYNNNLTKEILTENIIC